MSGDFRLGSWVVRPSQNIVEFNGKPTHLEPKVMEVLVCLADQAGEVVAKDRLIRAVWADTFVTDDVLTRSIYELRRVFEENGRESRVIQTIHKRGYRLVAPVVPVQCKTSLASGDGTIATPDLNTASSTRAMSHG